MNKLLAAAMAVGMVTSAATLGNGVAAAEATGEPALVVSGTTRPVPWVAKRLYHFDPSTTTEIGGKYYNSGGANRQIIPYPGTVWPLTGLNSQTVGESVYEGTNNLDRAIRSTTGPMTVVGLSQGSEVINEEQVRLANDPNAPPPDQVTFIKVSSPQHLLESLFPPGTHIPFVDYTVPPQVDSQYNTVEVVAQYDLYADPPQRFGNVLADINSVLGRDHSLAAFSDPASVPPQNITATTNSRGATMTTYLVPATELPLVAQLRKWGVPDPLADQMDQVMRPMVDRAYGPPPPPLAANLPALPVNLANTPVNLANTPVNLATLPINAVTLPINAATTAVNAATSAVNAARLVNQVRLALPKGNRR